MLVKRFRGINIISIRECYNNGKKRINLMEDEWEKLFKQMHHIQSAVETLKKS